MFKLSKLLFFAITLSLPHISSTAGTAELAKQPKAPRAIPAGANGQQPMQKRWSDGDMEEIMKAKALVDKAKNRIRQQNDPANAYGEGPKRRYSANDADKRNELNELIRLAQHMPNQDRRSSDPLPSPANKSWMLRIIVGLIGAGGVIAAGSYWTLEVPPPTRAAIVDSPEQLYEEVKKKYRITDEDDTL